MATVTGKTAAAMDAIADASVVTGTVNGSGHLILTTHGGTDVDAGNVVGPTGATGATGASGATASLDAIATANPTAADVALNSHKLTGVSNGSSSSDAATVGQVALKTGTTFTGGVDYATHAVTFGATMAIDASVADEFSTTLTASTGKFSNPTNPGVKRKIDFVIKQDATGGRTVSWDTKYSFGSGSAPTLSAAANKTDVVGFQYNAVLDKWLYLGITAGH
jgi:hypothetical protein